MLTLDSVKGRLFPSLLSTSLEKVWKFKYARVDNRYTIRWMIETKFPLTMSIDVLRDDCRPLRSQGDLSLMLIA